jgi:hypothetical protein
MHPGMYVHFGPGDPKHHMGVKNAQPATRLIAAK